MLKDGYTVVVVGEKHHPEVKSIVEWSDDTALVVETVAEARNVPYGAAGCCGADYFCWRRFSGNC